MSEQTNLSNHISDFLNSPHLQSEVANISPRLDNLLSQLCSIFSTAGHEWLPDQQEKLHLSFKVIQYTHEPNSSPFCRMSDKKMRYYRCFDCEIISSCFCEQCFNGPQHEGHQFKIISNDLKKYCVCGNEEYVCKEHFCQQHQFRGHQQEKEQTKSNVPARQRELFSKEIEFLLFLGFQVKQKGIKDYPLRAQLIIFKVLQTLVSLCKDSFTYQQLTSQLLLQHFRNKQTEKQTILHQLMWEEWNPNTSAALSSLLSQLYVCRRAKKAILVEYFHLFTSKDHSALINPLSQIDSQYFMQGNLILKLLKGRLIPPLAFSCSFSDAKTAIFNNIQLYRAYQFMQHSPLFIQILEETLTLVKFSQFFSFAIIDKERRDVLYQVTHYYLVFLNSVIIKLQDFKDKANAEKKIIRECYQYIKTKEETYSFAPQTTIGLTIFSYCNLDIDSMRGCSVEWMMDILGEESFDEMQKMIEKMLGSYCKVFRIQNYQDYHQLYLSNSELNRHNKIILSMDYIALRIIVTLLAVINRQKGWQAMPLNSIQVGKFSVLEKLIDIFRSEKKKIEAVADPQVKAKVAIFKETGLCAKLDDQIVGVTREFVAFITNLLFACQSDICETVFANSINKVKEVKILYFLKQFASLYPNKSKLAFKTQVESLIFNQKLIKRFILEKQNVQNHQNLSYQESNITYCSHFFQNQITQDTNKRLTSKLQSNTYGTLLTRFLFSEPMIEQLINIAELLFRFVTQQVDIRTAANLNIAFNLLIQLMIVLFIETRNPKLKKLIFRINETPLIRDNYTNYIKVIIGIVMDHFREKEEAEDEDKRKEAANAKREDKKRLMKEIQSKVLDQHADISKNQDLEEDTDLCIICKAKSTENMQLGYLCNLRFSNKLTRSVLGSDRPMMVITTCGHKIHESCLAASIDAQDKYDTKYNCFLCKQLSNLRIPISLAPAKIEVFLDYLLTIISLQGRSIPSLASQAHQYAQIGNLSRLLYDNIVLSIFLYFYSISKFYNANILPIVRTQINILTWLNRSFPVPTKVQYENKDSRLTLIQNKLNKILNADARVEQIASIQDKQQLIDQLFLKIHNPSLVIARQIKEINRLGFMKLPIDLRDLVKMIGRCQSCHRYNNQMMACFLCGFKCCSDCNSNIIQHLEIHLGTGVFIDMENGRLSYRFKTLDADSGFLYANYVGEQFKDEQALPPKGEYEIDQQRVEKLVDAVLKDQIQQLVEDLVPQKETIIGCNIQ